MTISTYSTILSIGSIVLLAYSLLVTFENRLTLISKFNSTIIAIINKLSSKKLTTDTLYILIIALVSGLSIAGALVYEHIYNTAPCVMCWWGRIALFPLFPIAILALNYKITNVSKILMLLSFSGLLITSYHYYYHFNIYVLDNILSMPCDANPLLPTCSNNDGILVFGFITMPLMGLMNFLSFILLANKVKE